VSASGWEEILDDGETILWQGRPDGAFALSFKGIGLALFGIFFTGFSLVWMSMAFSAPDSFWRFGLIHFAAGILMMVVGVFGGTYRRRHSWYSLSTKRAFIATKLPFMGQRLKSYPITKASMLDFRAGALANIFFATRKKRTNNGSVEVPVGFLRL